MGFGYGYSSRSDHGGKRYNNSQTAHVWNAQTEKRGQSNNGNLYFDGPAIYSYGSHFLAGYIMPDGVALLNGDHYSVSTSGHMSDVRGAVGNRATFTIAGLTALADMLRAISAENRSAGRKAQARGFIRDNAEALASARLMQPGESSFEWLDEADESGRRYRERDMSHAMTAGEYLTRAAGLPAQTWPKLEREAAAIKAKREAANAKRERDNAKALAIRAADMTGAEWRRALSVTDSNGRTYDAESRLGRLALDLFRAVRTAKKEGLSARRRTIISARHKEARERLAHVAELAAIVNKREAVRSNVRELRDSASRWRELAGDLPTYHMITNLGRTATAAEELSKSPMFPFVTRRRLLTQSVLLKKTSERLLAEHLKAEQEARELKEAEHKAAWLAGTAPLAGRRFDAESGGAALRINGNRLETSHGADVPLPQAIRAFRFIKLCKEAGREWRANGQQVRVGSFHLDWIDSAGNMKAGCHSFTWPEIERAAALAGVANEAPSDEAVKTKESQNEAA